jgi:hypothetical protein
MKCEVCCFWFKKSLRQSPGTHVLGHAAPHQLAVPRPRLKRPVVRIRSTIQHRHFLVHRPALADVVAHSVGGLIRL